MPNQLFMEERRRLILEQLNKNGRVSVKDLSQKLQVSEVTIRQDLRMLEANGLLERTHGGAVERHTRRASEQPELSFDIRRTRQNSEKDIIGRYVATLIQPGYAVALDASTTVCSLIPYLAEIDGLTIVTNNLLVAEMLLPQPRIQVLLPAGRLRRDSYSVVGRPETLPDINLNIGFVSAWGLTPEDGLTEVSEQEMAMKQALLARCKQRIVLVDSSKWGLVAPYTYAQFDEVHRIITTDQAPTALVQAMNHHRVTVISTGQDRSS